MIVPLGLGDGKADRHGVEKGGGGLAEIVADVERQLIGADAKRLAGNQRRVGAAVGIGDGFLQQRRGRSRRISCSVILTPAGRAAG